MTKAKNTKTKTKTETKVTRTEDEMKEANIKKKINFWLKIETIEDIRNLAKRNRIPMGFVIESLIEERRKNEHLGIKGTKKVVEGKLYDVEGEGVTLIAQWNNGYGIDQLKYYSEELYRTAKGAYFLLKEGGADSPMKVSAKAGRQQGSRDIIPLPPRQRHKFPLNKDEPYLLHDVIAWLERRNFHDILGELFPEDIELA